MSRSVSFDRAADFYDRTRTLTDEARAGLTDVLGGALRGHEPVLEIGVGTGRIALPLHDSGIDLMGLDISEPMLRKLVANGGGRAPFPICRADATRLPFAADSFGAALSAHVLHLIPQWRNVVDELFRVLRPGAVVLVDMGGRAARHKEWAEIVARFLQEAGIKQRSLGLDRIDELAEAMARRGATGEILAPVANRRPTTYSGMVDYLAEGRSSFTWQVEETARRAAAARTRAWAETRFGDLSTRSEVRHDIYFHAFYLP